MRFLGLFTIVLVLLSGNAWAQHYAPSVRRGCVHGRSSCGGCDHCGTSGTVYAPGGVSTYQPGGDTSIPVPSDIGTYDSGTYAPPGGGYDSGVSGSYDTPTDSGATSPVSPSPQTDVSSALTTPSSGFGSAGSSFTPPTSNRAGSNLLQGTSSVAGGYGLAGMETFGDAFGSNNGSFIGKGTLTYTSSYTGNFQVLSDVYTVSDVALKGVSETVSVTGISDKYIFVQTGSGLGTAEPMLDEPTILSGSLSNQSLRNDAVMYLGNLASNITYDEDNSIGHNIDYTLRLFTNPRFVYNYEIPIQAVTQHSLGRVKISENMSPLPQDRFIFDYSYFHNVSLSERKGGVHRFTPGFEKTFFCGRSSFELRFPMGVTVDSNRMTDGHTDLHAKEFGDITMNFKTLLYRSRTFALSAGLGLTVPTADDVNLYNYYSGHKIIGVKNESVHLMPFIGMLWTPNNHWYAQMYYQIDVDANGNQIDFRDFSRNVMVQGDRKARDMTYQYMSFGLGRWLFRDFCRPRGFTAMNVVGELHWTRSLDHGRNSTFVDGLGNSMSMGNFNGKANVLNATIGTHMIFNRRHNVGVAFCTPLSNDKQFDGELRVTYNYHF